MAGSARSHHQAHQHHLAAVSGIKWNENNIILSPLQKKVIQIKYFDRKTTNGIKTSQKTVGKQW